MKINKFRVFFENNWIVLNILQNNFPFFAEILRSLQECPQYKLDNVEDEEINNDTVKYYIQEAMKSERKKNRGKTVIEEEEEEEVEDSEVLGDNKAIDEDESINEIVEENY